jgi:putative ribosome biogenesis GTPase RsgA
LLVGCRAIKLIEKFIVLASELTDIGLKEIKMNRLGHFVVLAGKNGAEKTRILNKLILYTKQRNEYKKFNKSLSVKKSMRSDS